MRKEAKLTTRGRVTIPPEVRRRLGARPGDYVLFDDASGTVRMTVEKRSRAKNFGNRHVKKRRD